jgi:heterodisulfide reductase subunit C
MAKLYEQLMQDVRLKEGLKACMNCGVCTGVCPSAEFYNYDPRQIVNIVQSRNEADIEALLKSDTMWYCGECMSCRPRCPRGNTPGYIIQALRTLSQKLGYFTESEKGRQQLAIKRVIGQNILDRGYCINPRLVSPELHPEQGPVWRWIYDHDTDVYRRFSPNYMQDGAGAGRAIDEETMKEIRAIFEVSGGQAFFDNIEECSERKAREMGYDGATTEYMMHVFTHNSNTHQ